MSVTVAMFFLIEATATCPAAPARLGGGAEVVRAVLDFEEQATEPPVVTPAGLSKPIGAEPGDPPETDHPDADPASARCRPAPVSIA